MQRQGRRAGAPRARLARAQADPAALRLIERHSAAVLRTARRYAATPEDAEDAYQRGLEILLTKAPAIPDSELLPWLKTVVKHEAFALRRGRERAGLVLAEPAEPAEDQVVWGAPVSTHEHVERQEKLRLGAEAMKQLKPQEVRCLLLLAEGYSYKQIQQETGFSYTKVNRCLTEGRRRFLDRVAGIESGAECDRLAPLLSALADGEARDVTLLRPHLRGCLGCRATLRSYREAPARVAALLPPIAVVAGADAPALGLRGMEGILHWMHERSLGLAMRVQGLAEMASAPKVAAVAASTAAIAGGSVATVHKLPDPQPSRIEHRAKHDLTRAASRPAPAAVTRTVLTSSSRRRAARGTAAEPAPEPTVVRATAPASQDPEARAEFAPEASPAAEPAPRATVASAPAPDEVESPPRTRTSDSGGSGDEFGM
jgi:RNA polymerase sigma factor (sigma-70 family)